MKKTHGLKTILASLLVTVALAAPAAVLSSRAGEVEAELYFSGVSLEVLSDGSIQAVVAVSVDKVINCNGATFVLDYNPDYFTPSYMVETTYADGVTHSQNEAYVSTTNPYDPGYFAYDPTLYKTDVNPFQDEVILDWVFDDTTMTLVPKKKEYSIVTIDTHHISMDLLLDQSKMTTETGVVGKLAPLKDVSLGGPMGTTKEAAYVINKYDTYDTAGNVAKPGRVTLGTLSFQANPDRLDEIAYYFPKPASGEVTPVEIPKILMDDGETYTYLVCTTKPDKGDKADDNWQIGVFCSTDDGDAMNQHWYRDAQNVANDSVGPAKLYYQLAVDPKQIVRVRPAEKAVTINAYQAFTDGTWDDVAQALRRYSPMASATYTDGTQENLVIPWGEELVLPWGEAGDEYSYTVEVQQEDGTFVPVDWRTDPAHPTPAYNPLEGVYRVSQYVEIPGRGIHPVPVVVTLTVTPVTLQRLEVENQTLTYDLAKVVDQVKSPSDLHLPTNARLITDIVPSGVSMVMAIPGWKPEQGSWPVNTTSNAETLMNALKEDDFGSITSTEEYFDSATMPYWPCGNSDRDAISEGEYGRFLKRTHTDVGLGPWIGEYTFHMADRLGADAQLKDGFTRAEIQNVFPWLTVPEEKYPVPSALRQIVTAESFTDAAEYTARYVSTEVVDDQPQLTLSVSRTGVAMSEDSIFRVWLPNGQELGTGLSATVWPDVETEVDDWFPTDDEGEQNGTYYTKEQGEAGSRYFHLVTNPGDPTTGGEETFPGDRETLRRYINLGGWYYVAVCENPEIPATEGAPATPATKGWSDPMPVYVPPRPNEYQADKEYNFVGENADLFNWPGGLTHYVTMPQGSYTAVTDEGVRLYNVDGEPVTLAQMLADQKTYGNYLDEKKRPKDVERYEESYGYHTTYNGSTGAQPGTLHSFRVGPTGVTMGTAWQENPDGATAAAAVPSNVPIWRYGPDPFYDGAIYPNYGTVTQPVNTRPTETQPVPAEPYTVTVRRSGKVATPTAPGKPRITLTSDSPTGITRTDPNDMGSNVTLATYDTRTHRYTDRQEYTFTITNVGDAPIYGLAIDGLTDGYLADPKGGRFELVQAPASFLSPGQSTTFVMTYVYNLGANGDSNPDIYRDKLYIISSDHPNGNYGGTDQDHPDENDNYDYLLDFDAQFMVTGFDTHTVTVIVNPDDLSMGSAGLIVGKQNNTMNYTVTTRSYVQGETVYVAVYMKDEYKIWDITCDDETISIPEFLSKDNDNIPLQPGIRIFTFTMPNNDVTVTINLYEDILSKLRLSDIVDFSAGEMTDLKSTSTDPVDKDNTYEVWRKRFTTDEYDKAQEWVDDHTQNPEEDLYLMTAGSAIPREENGRAFIDTDKHYIVVIPYKADFSQVEAKLRKLVTYNNYEGTGKNVDIMPDVVMHHYGEDIRDTWNLTVDTADKKYDSQYDDSLPKVGNKGVGDTSVPTVHTSEIFESPTPGTSNYVRITVSYSQNGVETSRRYYLEIHRKPKVPEATLNYGNSPYGMIMNDYLFRRSIPAETKRVQEGVKETFRENGYTFYGLGDMTVPRVVLQGKVSADVVYWREAWVHNTKLFEPESLTGFKVEYPTPDDDEPADPTISANRRDPVITIDPAVYQDEENLDLNDEAFFAILGEKMREPGIAEAKDSTGREVKLEDIHAQVTVTLLDTDTTTQIGRFSGTNTVTLDMGNLDELGRGKLLEWLQGAAAEGNWPVSSQTVKNPVTEETVKVYTPVENIRPGQYVLTYTYKDYDDTFLEVTRPLVILSSVGDVNSDGGVVDLDDETVLKNRVADPLGYVVGRWELVETPSGKWEEAETVYPRSNVFKYRVVDVNNDRNINNIDGNLIRKITDGKATAIRFYNPVDYINPSPGT